MYAAHKVKITGTSEDFTFSCDLIQLDAMTFASMSHSMPTEVDMFDGLRDLSVVEHQDGDAVRLTIGTETVNLREGECILLPPDQPLQAALDTLGVAVTTISMKALQSAAAARIDHKPVEINFSRPVTPVAGRHWSQTIRYVEGVIRNSPLLVSAPLARSELGWLVDSAVLACFPNSTFDAGTASYPGDTPQPLRRALGFIDEHASDPITLDDIAMAARLSPRGLQAAFRRHLDTTPLAYLRGVRMERAHRDLQNAEPGDGVSVAGLAARWGFTHLGRFAVEYRRRFGAYPSQTLRG
jgi:AraC-like DNA-binding protein